LKWRRRSGNKAKAAEYGGVAMADEDFPYSVVEDQETIAKFKRIKDATLFTANYEWRDMDHTVSLVIERLTSSSTR
jgi:hypothetical protein